MRLLNTTLLGLALAALPAVAAIDAGLLNLVPPDAKIISGVQVDNSKNSRFGQYVLGQMSFDDAGMQKFVAETGFDPRRDLGEILVATTGSMEAPQFVVLGRGVFNPGKIVTAAAAAGAAVSSYGGVQLISHGGKGEHAMGFLDAGTAVMGSAAAVKAVIDRRTSNERIDAALAAKVRDLAATHDAWFVSTVPVSDFFSGKMAGTPMGQASGGQLFQAIKSAQGGIKFTAAGIQISGEALTRSEQDATALSDVIRFVAGLLQQNKEQNAQTQQISALLESLQLSTDKATLKLSLAIPEEVAEQLFMPKKNRPAARQGKNRAALR